MRKESHQHDRDSHAVKHHFHISYPVKLLPRVYSTILTPLIVLAIIFLGVHFLPGSTSITDLRAVSVSTIITAIAFTFIRLFIAYMLALIVAIPLSFLAHKSQTMERILLPLFDVIQSVPVLAFFPILVLFFVKFNFLDGAAVFIIFLSMLWNIVFSLVGGLKVIPGDINAAAHVFNVRGLTYFSRVALPAVVPYLVTGSLLAWAQGWNIIIVAEVLHTYIPHGLASQDLFGIGSLLVQSISQGQTNAFLYSLLGMVIVIAGINFLVWQKLLHYAERFRFE
jgi:NitT/TauT family transport system permease protein